jgi:hypothetical protein
MKIVEVFWRDSAALRGWRPASDIEENTAMEDYLDCRTAGYLLHSLPDRIVIAQSASLDIEQVADVMTIPREAISQIKELGIGWSPTVEDSKQALADRPSKKQALADRPPAPARIGTVPALLPLEGCYCDKCIRAARMD